MRRPGALRVVRARGGARAPEASRGHRLRAPFARGRPARARGGARAHLGGDRREVPAVARVLGEHRRASGHERVDERHGGGTRECERLPRDLRCAERGAEPREQVSREKQAQQRREKARRFPPPSRVLRVSKFDSNRPSFDRAKKILTGRNVLLRRSIGIAPRFERARVPDSKIPESFALVAPSGSRLLGFPDLSTAQRAFSLGVSDGVRAVSRRSVRWRARTGLFALKSFLFSSERGGRDLAYPARRLEGRASRTSRRPREPALRARAELLGHSRQVRRERESVRGRADRRDPGHADRRFGAGR